MKLFSKITAETIPLPAFLKQPNGNRFMRAYKFRIYPSEEQEKKLKHHLWLEKELWNEMLEFTKKIYSDHGKFPTQRTLRSFCKNSELYSQVGQALVERLNDATWRMVELRKQGRQCGFPRFKSFDRMNSLNYPQSGFKLEEKLNVTPFGLINIKKHREIDGKIKTLTIKLEPTGKWFATFSAETQGKVPKPNTGSAIGIDLGLKTFMAFSDGTTIKNPRHLRKHEERLAHFQRRLSRKKKGSRNRRKARFTVARAYEKIANARMDFLHKISTNLVNSYSFIALEKLASQEMAEQRFGKSINDAGWGMFARMIAYKAEEAGCKVVFVNPENTSQECSNCHKIVRKDLSVRTHECPHCGLVLDRDFNAARNILKRATAGIAGSNACGDLPSSPSGQGISLKQEEAHDFSRG